MGAVCKSLCGFILGLYFTVNEHTVCDSVSLKWVKRPQVPNLRVPFIATLDPEAPRMLWRCLGRYCSASDTWELHPICSLGRLHSRCLDKVPAFRDRGLSRSAGLKLPCSTGDIRFLPFVFLMTYAKSQICECLCTDFTTVSNSIQLSRVIHSQAERVCSMFARSDAAEAGCCAI